MSTDDDSNTLRIVRNEVDNMGMCLAYGVAKYLENPDLIPSKPENKVDDVAASIVGAAKIYGAKEFGLKIFHNE
jgi:hypothetical protein